MFLQIYLVKLVKQDGKNNQACSEHDSDLEESARSLFLWNYPFWILGCLSATSIRPHSPKHKKPCVSCGQFEPGDVRWAYGVRKVPSKALRHHATRLCLKVLCAKGVLFLCMATCCVWLHFQFLFFFDDVGPCGVVDLFYIKHKNKHIILFSGIYIYIEYVYIYDLIGFKPLSFVFVLFIPCIRFHAQLGSRWAARKTFPAPRTSPERRNILGELRHGWSIY